jgi:hypothetical protein
MWHHPLPFRPKSDTVDDGSGDAKEDAASEHSGTLLIYGSLCCLTLTEWFRRDTKVESYGVDSGLTLCRALEYVHILTAPPRAE